MVAAPVTAWFPTVTALLAGGKSYVTAFEVVITATATVSTTPSVLATPRAHRPERDESETQCDPPAVVLPSRSTALQSLVLNSAPTICTATLPVAAKLYWNV
eukprot:3331974-Rhodomonas_salina.1